MTTRILSRAARLLVVAAVATALGGCTPSAEAPAPAPAESTPADTLDGSRWSGLLDGNSISIELEPDGTVLVDRYNGTGPFDVDDDVWEERDGVLSMTLTGLYVLGDDPRAVNVTVRGEVDGDELTLTGDYSDGAPATMELTPIEVP